MRYAHVHLIKMESKVSSKGDIMLEIKSKKATKPSTGGLLSIAGRPVYPFFLLRLGRTKKGQTSPTVVNLKVDGDIYDYLTKAFGTNELIVYLDPSNGKIEAWTPGMHLTFEAMEELGLMEPAGKWLEKARPFLNKTLSQVTQRMG